MGKALGPKEDVPDKAISLAVKVYPKNSEAAPERLNDQLKREAWKVEDDQVRQGEDVLKLDTPTKFLKFYKEGLINLLGSEPLLNCQKVAFGHKKMWNNNNIT